MAPEQIPEGWLSPDVASLLADGGAEAYRAGDRLPIGLVAFPGRLHNALVLWIERVGALVAGDALGDFGRGFEVPQEGLPHGVTRGQVVEELRPLLRLPVEVVLPAHGAPTDRGALERALS
jgi:glyoxylase-like metal-dependent hydrolase (beta-lactamase superfamily II)